LQPVLCSRWSAQIHLALGVILKWARFNCAQLDNRPRASCAGIS
jgi:hypothetical protein